MAAIDYLTFRSTLIYTAPGVQAPPGSIFTVGSSGVQTPLSSMIIHTSGNIGIGVETPTAALHLKNTTSAMRITGNLTSTSSRPALSTTPGVFEIRGSGVTDGANDGFLRLSAGGGTSTSLQSYIDLSGSNSSSDMNSTIVLGAGGTERIRITSSGNVGIGSTNPQYPLDLLGTAQMNGAVPAFGQPDVNPLPQSAYASFGQSWSATPSKLGQVAVSATGQYQTSCTYGTTNTIYYSNNYGQTWSASSGAIVSSAYTSIAMSGNGQYQLAARSTTNSALYKSSDYGQTWTSTGYTLGFMMSGYKSCLSFNGQYQFNISFGANGRVGISSDYGATFTVSTLPSAAYNSICCSSNGQYVSVGSNIGATYYSTNYGVSWTQSSVGNYSWIDICCSTSGQFQVGVTFNAGTTIIWNSNNYGADWTQITTLSEQARSMTCTSTCQYIILGTYGSYLYYSKNYGASWTQSTIPIDYWYSCSMSQNGQYALMSAVTSYSLQLVNYGLITNGRIGIGTTAPSYPLHVIGAIYASGNISAFSDQRYKQNIVRLDRSLDAIRSLGGYYYTREDYEPGIRQIGLLAQEVKAVLPEAVCYDSANDKYSVNYNCLIAPVVEAIKELYDRSEAQQQIIQAQQSAIQAQQSEIQAQQSEIQKLLDHLHL